MSERIQVRKQLLWMYVFLGVLITLSTIYGICIYAFNTKTREYNAGDVTDSFTLDIHPRTGQTDSWPKIIEEDGHPVDYKGTIYDIEIRNIGECNISDWTLRIDIERDCYLNNGWCGTFEVHQHKGDVDQVQILDLRNFKEEDVTLDYRVANPDLLIPLHVGDYIIYHPDIETKEYPIIRSVQGNCPEVVSGMIFYDDGDAPLAFPSFYMNYHLEKIFTQTIYFKVLCIGFLCWLILFTSSMAVEWNLRKAHKRFMEDEHIIKQSIGVFTRFFEAKDIYTNGHSQRVAKYSRMIAEKLHKTPDECRRIYYIGLLHDCGKCYIPDQILKKPDKLTPEEYEIIKSHTVKGAEMMEQFTSIEHVREGVLYHHERYDGKGYPEGLSGENIPLVGRIICIADTFDAMNSRRCYRNPLTREYIISEFETNRGKQFDPDLVEVFLKMIDDGEVEVTGEI